jgi:hypothetical protein
VRFLLAVGFALPLLAQSQDKKADPTSELAAQRHRKAVELVELSGGRARLQASIPDMVEQGKAEMRKECPDCHPEFLKEWGKRMTARFNADDFVNVAARAYEKRFTNDELAEFVAVMASQKTEKPLAPSAFLQKKLADLQPAIMDEIVGGCEEIGTRLGAEVGAEILKEHPEYEAKSKKE